MEKAAQCGPFVEGGDGFLQGGYQTQMWGIDILP